MSHSKDLEQPATTGARLLVDALLFLAPPLPLVLDASAAAEAEPLAGFLPNPRPLFVHVAAYLAMSNFLLQPA